MPEEDGNDPTNPFPTEAGAAAPSRPRMTDVCSLLRPTPTRGSGKKRPRRPRRRRDGSPGADDSRKNQHEASPVVDSLRRYVATRTAGGNDALTINIPASLLSPPLSRPLDKLWHNGPPQKIKQLSVCKQPRKRRALCLGKDDIIIEIYVETEHSSVTSALVRKLDDLKKDRTSFSCHVHPESPLLSKKCVCWLQKKKQLDGSCTHEKLPYLLIVLDAAEFLTELKKESIDEFLAKVSKSCPRSIVTILIVGLNHYLRIKRRAPYPYTVLELEAMLVDAFVKHTGMTYRFVLHMEEAAEHIVRLTCAYERIQQNRYDPSFLSVFGGCRMTEAILNVDLRLTIHPQTSDVRRQKLMEWIGLLHTIPGLGPKDAHGIALAFPSFAQLMEAYSSTKKSEAEKKLLVADIKQPPDNARKIGQSVSKALYAFFCNSSPDSFFDP